MKPRKKQAGEKKRLKTVSLTGLNAHKWKLFRNNSLFSFGVDNDLSFECIGFYVRWFQATHIHSQRFLLLSFHLSGVRLLYSE